MASPEGHGRGLGALGLFSGVEFGSSLDKEHRSNKADKKQSQNRFNDQRALCSHCAVSDREFLLLNTTRCL